MSIESTCDYCGLSDKNRCRSREAATTCPSYLRDERNRGIDFDVDFGFTEPVNTEEIIAENEASRKRSSALHEKAEDLDKRLNLMYNSIIPFLDRLMKGGEKDIHWPNRAEQIGAFKNKLTAIIEGKK